MGHKYTKEQIRTVALSVASEHGLAKLSFGRVAKQLGTSDRVVVYYFPTKADLVSEVFAELGSQLQSSLGQVLQFQFENHRDLVRAAWPVLANEEVDPAFALFFEAHGLAVTGQEPYQALVIAVVEDWIERLSSCMTGSPSRRRAESETALAVLDGLLLLRQTAGPAAASRAVAVLTKRDGTSD